MSFETRWVLLELFQCRRDNRRTRPDVRDGYNVTFFLIGKWIEVNDNESEWKSDKERIGVDIFDC